MAEHRTRISEAEVDVSVSIHVDDFGAVALFCEKREWAGPLNHPVHRNATNQCLLCPLEQLLRFRVDFRESLLLTRHDSFYFSVLNECHETHIPVLRFTNWQCGVGHPIIISEVRPAQNLSA